MTRRAKSRPRPINLSRDAFRHLAAALGVATLLSASARADWLLTNSDLKQDAHLIINTWTPAEGFSITNQSGKLSTISTRDVLTLYSAQRMISDPASRASRLGLRNGDVLYGDAQGISGKSLLFKTADLGTLAIPLKRVATFNMPVIGPGTAGDKKLKTAAAPDHDLVVFKETGDRLEGLVTGIDDSKIQLAANDAAAPTDIALSKIDAIVFGGAKPPREIPPLSIRLTFTSGTVYTVPLGAEGFNWTLNKITLKDAAGQEHTTTADRINTAEVLGGRVVYLTELDFSAEEQVSLLGTAWPAQINKNALGQPLRVARQTYERGLGVHTQSSLVYQLDGSFDTLSLRVGLDDSAAPLGEAQASIILDGKRIWPTGADAGGSNGGKILKPGEISAELALPIKGGKRLELHADPAARLDVQGRVDWLNIALRRQ